MSYWWIVYITELWHIQCVWDDCIVAYSIRIGHGTLVVRVQDDRINHWVLFVVKPVYTAMLVIFNEHTVEYLVIFKAHRNVSNIQGKQWVAELYGAKHVNVHLNYGIVTKAQQLWICKQSTTKPSSGNFKEEREERHASLISLLQSTNTPLWLAKAPGFGDKTLQFIKLSNYQIHCNTLIPNTPLMHKYEMQMHKCWTNTKHLLIVCNQTHWV